MGWSGNTRLQIYPGLHRIKEANGRTLAGLEGPPAPFYEAVMKEALTTVSGHPTGNLPDSLHSAYTVLQQRITAYNAMDPDMQDDIDSLFTPEPEEADLGTLTWFLERMVRMPFFGLGSAATANSAGSRSRYRTSILDSFRFRLARSFWAMRRHSSVPTTTAPRR